MNGGIEEREKAIHGGVERIGPPDAVQPLGREAEAERLILQQAGESFRQRRGISIRGEQAGDPVLHHFRNPAGGSSRLSR